MFTTFFAQLQFPQVNVKSFENQKINKKIKIIQLLLMIAS
jgi:hypothetical protein